MLHEVQYLFDLEGLGIFPPFTLDQQQLSDTMIGYWAQFAKAGNPNSAGAPLWSPYSPATDQFQSLAPPTPMVESNFDTAHLYSVLWDTF
jgi:para-nitrobenzyl esterase